MDSKYIGLAAVMTLSSLILTERWLNRFGESDIIIILSAMVLAGSLAGMILMLDMRLRAIDENMNAKERSMRITIKGMEENIDKKMEAIAQNTRNSIGEFSKRIYR